MFGKHRVKLDPALHERAARRADELGYGSLDEWVTHLLETVLAGDASPDELRERLRGLGYLE